MKYFVPIIVFSFLLSMSSCLEKKKIDEKCLPAVILIVYLGGENKPTYPLLIKTNETDTSYYKFIGGGKEKFDKYGFDISANYIRVSTINYKTYSIFKKYISYHNNHNDRNLHSATLKSIKILLSDQCTFQMYTIDESENKYFSDLIDTLQLNGGDELKKYLKYYQEIQDWNNKSPIK